MLSVCLWCKKLAVCPCHPISHSIASICSQSHIQTGWMEAILSHTCTPGLSGTFSSVNNCSYSLNPALGVLVGLERMRHMPYFWTYTASSQCQVVKRPSAVSTCNTVFHIRSSHFSSLSNNTLLFYFSVVSLLHPPHFLNFYSRAAAVCFLHIHLQFLSGHTFSIFHLGWSCHHCQGHSI